MQVGKRLPFETEVVICKGDDVLELISANPFAGQPAGPEIVWFVSILAKRGRPSPSIPFNLPSGDEWSLKILSEDRFVLVNCDESPIEPGQLENFSAFRNNNT